MVPSQIIVLDEVPLNPVGKLDRRALPEPDLGISYREFRAPTTPIEETVANVFAEVLGVQGVGLDDDFFELGGNSLLATQVVSRLGVALDAQVPVRACSNPVRWRPWRCASSRRQVAERASP